MYGNPNLRPGTRFTALTATQERARQAKQRAEDLRMVIENARSQGLQSLRALASYLNRLGIETAQGSTWQPSTVSRVLAHLHDCSAPTASETLG